MTPKIGPFPRGKTARGIAYAAGFALLMRRDFQSRALYFVLVMAGWLGVDVVLWLIRRWKLPRQKG
jgi:hypothetical protein